MRQFNNYEAVKINSEEEAMEFLQYLEDNTDLKWYTGDKPTGISQKELNKLGFPIFFNVVKNVLHWARGERVLEDGTKIIPLSEFFKPKATYTREQAKKVLEDYNLFCNNPWSLNLQAVSFLNHKFPKSTLEQVTEAVKEIGDFLIEQNKSGSIIISPINNK